MIKQTNGVYRFTTRSAIADAVMILLFLGGAISIGLPFMEEELNKWFFVGIGAACVVAGVLLLTVFKFTRLVAEISEEGIIESASKVSKGLIRWEEIEDVYLYNIVGIDKTIERALGSRRRGTETIFVGIFLVDVDSYSKKLSIIQKGIMSADLKLGYAPISIPHNLLVEDADEFVSICKTMLEKKRAKTAG